MILTEVLQEACSHKQNRLSNIKHIFAITLLPLKPDSIYRVWSDIITARSIRPEQPAGSQHEAANLFEEMIIESERSSLKAKIATITGWTQTYRSGLG